MSVCQYFETLNFRLKYIRSKIKSLKMHQLQNKTKNKHILNLLRIFQCILLNFANFVKTFY